MNGISIQKTNDVIKCADIHCEEILGIFDLKKNRKFCHKCRGFHKVLLWRCEGKGCNNILSSVDCRETRKYCKKCSGLAKAD